MKNFVVHIEQTRHTDIEVKANSWDDAVNMALEKARNDDDCWGCYENNVYPED